MGVQKVNLIKALLAGAFSLLALSTSYAAEPHALGSLCTKEFQKALMTEEMLRIIDTSGKGVITRADYDRYMNKLFDTIDTAHQGVIDQSKFTAIDHTSSNVWPMELQKAFRSAAMLRLIDKSGKGRVTKAAFSDHMGAIFETLDTNHDGILESNEFIYTKAFGPG
jgi:Ca2+-binding EF-hand superfamily protein